MKARFYSVVSIVLVLLLVGAMGTPAQHKEHGGQMPGMPGMKATKKSPARNTSKKSKRVFRAKQTTGSAQQKSSQMQSPHAGHQSVAQQSEMQHSGGMHQQMGMQHTATNQQSSMQARGSADGVMPDEAHDTLAVAYAQNIAAFARTLRDQVRATQAVDPVFAQYAVGEMRRSFVSLREHRERNSVSPAGAGHQMGGAQGATPHPMASMPGHSMSSMSGAGQRQTGGAQPASGTLPALELSLAALELEAVSAAPAAEVILQRAEDVIRAAESAASRGGHEGHNM